MQNWDIINKDDNTEISQNNDKIKADILYSIEYQYIISSAEYNLDSMTHTQYKDPNNNNEFDDIEYHSRRNILSFKLCHKNRGTCKELGISDDGQKCESCPNYYYDDNLSINLTYTLINGN